MHLGEKAHAESREHPSVENNKAVGERVGTRQERVCQLRICPRRNPGRGEWRLLRAYGKMPAGSRPAGNPLVLIWV
jgi:hypothetical protein